MNIAKKVVFAVAALVFVLVLALAGLMVSVFRNAAPLPESADLPGDARLVKDGMVAFFVLPAGGQSVALVDCGNDPGAAKVLSELERRGATPEDVKAIFLTHGHGDHTAGCHRFPQAEVMALSADVNLAAGREAARGLLTRFRKNGPGRSATVTRGLRDGEEVQVGDLSVRVLSLPGHTDGSAAFLAGGVLFLGDSAMSLKDGRLAGAPGPFTNDVQMNHASLRALWGRLKLERLAVETLAFSHSAPQQGIAALGLFASGKK